MHTSGLSHHPHTLGLAHILLSSSVGDGVEGLMGLHMRDWSLLDVRLSVVLGSPVHLKTFSSSSHTNPCSNPPPPHATRYRRFWVFIRAMRTLLMRGQITLLDCRGSSRIPLLDTPVPRPRDGFISFCATIHLEPRSINYRREESPTYLSSGPAFFHFAPLEGFNAAL